ncbi:MAG: porin, partial [Zoogloeaceae bacterium]|nr:porin [Zoogloeaceae bacterium]
MKQKLIPLAIACLASGAAFAQTNVQIYGTVDVGFARRGDNVADNVGKQNAFNSGQSGTSLVGFKGVEDLGNGLKALFVLEAGFAADTGSHVDGDKLFNEQAFLGLTGNWGTAIAGRLVAPRHGFLSAIDPFGAGTVGQYRNVYNDVEFHRDAIDLVNDKAGLTGDDRYSALKLADVDRVDNAIAYVSPSFSGFNVTVAYATQAIGQEGNGISYGASTDNDGDAKVFTILPRYTNGPLDVGAVYQRIKVKEVLPG